MKTYPKPWQLLLLILANWINHRQQDVIEYLRTENDMLREKLAKKRILLNDDQRRRLAVKGKILGRKMLEQVATIGGKWELRILSLSNSEHSPFEIGRNRATIPTQSCAKVCI